MVIIIINLTYVEDIYFLFSRSKIADFYCFSIDKRQLEKRASMLNARTTHVFHIFDEKILGRIDYWQ